MINLIFDNFDVSRIVNCYRLSCAPCQSIKAMPRQCHAFVCFLNGTSKYTYGEKVYQTKPNTFIYLPKNQPYTINRFENIEALVLDFETFQNDGPNDVYCREFGTLDLLHLFEKALAGYHDTRTPTAKIKSIFYSMLSLLQKIELDATYTPSSIAQLLSPAIDYIHKEYKNKDINNVMLANLCNVSERYFVQCFLRHMGAPPHQYTMQLRLKYAKTLLKTADISISDIAKNCGFKNVYYFSRLFKEKTGVTPKEYKNNSIFIVS